MGWLIPGRSPGLVLSRCRPTLPPTNSPTNIRKSPGISWPIPGRSPGLADSGSIPWVGRFRVDPLGWSFPGAGQHVHQPISGSLQESVEKPFNKGILGINTDLAVKTKEASDLENLIPLLLTLINNPELLHGLNNLKN
ncbi:MAG: hypothetical protein ACYDH1_15905 [Anaerolineaceae bacterium]